MIRSNFKKETRVYHCTLTPLTPIHIGSGNELTPYEYIIKDKIFYRISLESLLSKLSEKDKKELIRLLETTNFTTARKFLQEIYKPEYGYYYSSHVDDDVIEIYDEKLDGASNPNEENKLSVEEFIGNYLGKYIPGSSLKGVIRSAYIGSNMTSRHYYKIERDVDKNTMPFLIDKNNIRKAKEESDKREATIIGLREKKPFYDPFKKILIKDSEYLRNLVEVRAVERVNKKQNMPLGSYEVTKSILSTGDIMEIKFEMDIADIKSTTLPMKEVLNRINKNPIVDEYKTFIIDKEKEGGLFYCLNKKAIKVLEEDKEFFNKVKNKEGIEACEEIEKYIQKLNSNEVLIKFGKGAGFNSTTLNVFNREIQKVYTRTTVSGLPCGWAILSYKEKR